MQAYTHRHIMTRSTFLTRCIQRGFFHQCTDLDGLDQLLTSAEQAGQTVPAYIGFDCTAPSLHVGSLLQIMLLRHYQQTGHKPIILLGGGTTKIGDPSGKDKSRQMLDEAAIASNKAGIRQVFARFMTLEETFDASSTAAVVVDNDEWLAGLSYIPFLRDVGRHFSVNQMLTMESVRQRLERDAHMSFLEFNYMILQAYDFVALYQRYGCRLQIGGSDQWGNITQGTELQRRMSHAPEREPLFGLTTPLLTTAAGAKMGKTADGAIWLDPERCSPYEYWQYWRNCDDGDVERFLRLFTELPEEEVIRYAALEGASLNEAKKRLADEATALLHGQDEARQAAETARQVFEAGQSDANLPGVTLSFAETGDSLPAFKLFALAGMAASGKEARRLIQGGGAKINDDKVLDEQAMIPLTEHVNASPLKLSSGKKKHLLVYMTG